MRMKMQAMKWMGAIALLPLGMALAFDLTVDRGRMSQDLKDGSGYSLMVFNIGTNNWGPVSNCGQEWATSQWRGYHGKRLGTTATKNSTVQFDMEKIANGWFTPNPQSGNLGCEQSHISRGWQDTYGMSLEDVPASSEIWPSYHVRVDPKFRYNPDENRVNNEAFVTMTWMGSRWTPLENMWITKGTKTLVPGDSVFLGVFSTNNANGTIFMTGTGTTFKWVQTLADGNEKYGYQARRMKVSLTGGAKNSYLVKNKSKVTAEFLGQNAY